MDCFLGFGYHRDFAIRKIFMIELKNISYQYVDTESGVSDINLEILKGECVALIGCSGNGKTTLTRLVNGLAPQYYQGSFSGEIYIDGKFMADYPLWLRGKTVGSIFQDPKNQFFSAELAGEVAFACENYGLSHISIVEKTNKAIADFGLEQRKNQSIDSFSSGEKQRTAIASVYALGPSVYVFDEPTANLDEDGAAQLAETLKFLKSMGKTILIAEHRLHWLMDIADRFVYIDSGHIVWQRSCEQMLQMEKSERITFGLRSFTSMPYAKLCIPEGKGVPAISAKTLSCKRRKCLIWEGIDFDAWAGQVVAITGSNGAGKTTFAKVLTGLLRSNSGKVMVDGKIMSAAARRKQIWYSDNDTDAQFFTDSVSEELLLCSDRSEETLERARELLIALDIYSHKDVHPATLSGGQKQRLSIACGMLSDRPVMIFDEPTSGLDGRNLRLVSRMFRQAAEQGKCVLIITHDHELIQECCTHRYMLK